MARGRDVRALPPDPRRRSIGVAGVLSTFALAVALALGACAPSPGSTSPAGSPDVSSSPGPPTPPGTGLVARLPIGADATFSWAPDGGHLLVSDDTGGRVYDRFGKLVSEFPSVEGWLDSSHLIGADGSVADISASHPGTSPAGSAVVANGRGSAAIAVSRPACGDRAISWYRDGHYVSSGESGTPFGWSPDGRDLVLGQESCGSSDAAPSDSSASAGPGWKGQVQLVDFASGQVTVTIPGVRGEMAFSPDGSSFAAQSDLDLEIAESGSTDVDVVQNVRFLGWLDVESLFVAIGNQISFVDLDPLYVSPTPYQLWQASSPAGLHLAGNLAGMAVAIYATDGSTLLDLSSAGLVAERSLAAGEPFPTGFQPDWWSPDSRMLALESADGASLDLISVDPTHPGTMPPAP